MGSAKKQKRHVTPYAFIESGIKAVIMKIGVEATYVHYIDNIIDAFKALIKCKSGICLEANEFNQFNEYVKNDKKLNKKQIEMFYLMTYKADKSECNEYYLIYSTEHIEFFIDKFNKQDRRESYENQFSKKLEKYIDNAFKYLKGKVIKDQKDPNAIAMVCEALIRAVLTVFNTDQHAAFPAEGNSSLEEIRLYKDPETEKEYRGKSLQDQKEAQAFEKMSNNDIVKRITQARNQYTGTEQDINKKIKEEYDFRIRIVDNEGDLVKKVTKALCLLNDLLGSKASLHYDSSKDKENEYNAKYNVDLTDITEFNLDSVFQSHVAKHLFDVFDFKPLENEVLAPKLSDNSIVVYRYFDGDNSAQYSIQNGDNYRAEEVNRAGSYNKKVMFRSKMSDNDTQDILRKKIVDHVTLSLIPFESIRSGIKPLDDIQEDTQPGRTSVFLEFLHVVTAAYQKAGYSFLNEDWKEKVKTEYNLMTKAKPSHKLDDSIASSIADEQSFSTILGK